VNWTSVTDLLKQVVWGDHRLNRTCGSRKHGKTVYDLNLVQYIYLRLYDARNDFLHGNRIGQRVLRVWQHGNADRPLITELAPVVYRTALHAYLTSRVPMETDNDLDDIILEGQQERYRDCLLQLVGPVQDDG
jgi:hypothetical protein